jgi:hypothetical protein
VLEARGDLWALARPGDAIVITTNGFVKSNGHAVMGRGIAIEATQRDPSVSLVLGHRIHERGNHVHLIHLGAYPGDVEWLSMPVKHHWKQDADPRLISRSAEELVTMVGSRPKPYGTVWMPRPGCGNGRLNWSDVKPLLDDVLDDRFVAVTF